MATHLGSEGVIKAGGTAIGELTGYSLETSAEIVDASILSSTSAVNVAGKKSFSGSVELFFDETDRPQMTLVEGATIAFLFLPEGDTSGDYSYSGNGIVNSVSVSGGIDSIVTHNVSFTGTGALTRGTV